MGLAALAFAVGAALLQLQATLPAPGWSIVVPVLALVALRWRMAWVPAALAAGFFWAAACGHWRMNDWLAPELEGRDLAVVGVVSSLPSIMERGARFELEVEGAEGDARLPRKILLSWYGAAPEEEGAAPPAAMIHAGERWALTVRLRRPHGLVNPHGFDYEAWLLERGIGATGYVRMRPEPRRMGTRNSPLDGIERLREAVRDRFNAVLGATPSAGILAALAVGDQRAISREEWQLFNRTGVTHLMSLVRITARNRAHLAARLRAHQVD